MKQFHEILLSFHSLIHVIEFDSIKTYSILSFALRVYRIMPPKRVYFIRNKSRDMADSIGWASIAVQPLE